MAYDTMLMEMGLSEYCDYLNTNKVAILSLFGIGDNKNLRTLKFFIDAFKEIYNTVKGAKYEDQVVSSYLLSFMLYTIEHKDGHSKDELDSLDTSKYKIDTSFFSAFHQESEQRQEEKKIDFPTMFEQKYKDVFSQFRSNNLFVDYIFSGYLDKDALRKDVAVIEADYDRQVLTSEGRVYQRLNMMTKINDEDVTSLIEEMLSYVKADRYNLYDLLYIYSLLLKYDYWKIDGFELTAEIDAEFRASMDRQKLKHTFNNMFEVRTPYFENTSSDKSQYAKYTALKNHAVSINLLSKKMHEAIVCEGYLQAAKEGNIEKLHKYRESSDSRIPVAGIDWKEIVNIILTASNPVACEVCNDIIFFVPDSSVVPPDERVRMKDELLTALEDYFRSGDNRIRKVYINELRNHIREVLL